MPKKVTQEDFIKRCQLKHNNYYLYNKVKYTRMKDKICVTCPKHGDFWIAAKHHVNGCGCPKCNPGGMSMNTQEFIKKASRIHNNYYNYNNTKYFKSNQKVEIECPIHGIFWQRPNDHLNGKGCPKCARSKGEVRISSILDKYNIPYISQYNLNIEGHHVRIDFYVTLNQKQYFIEYNGIQHYMAIDYFGGKLALEKQQERDQIVKNYCFKNNINFIEIKYNCKDAEELLLKCLN